MKVVLLSVADEKYCNEQKYLSKTAKKYGGINEVVLLKPSDIDIDFKRKNDSILTLKRGAGYWLWKPYLISKELIKLDEGDYLFYCDSACFFHNDIKFLIKSMETNGVEIMPFESHYSEIHYTKSELLKEFNFENNEQAKYSPQIIASFILIRKSNFSINFINEYLKLCQNYSLISDELSENDLNNQLFIDHRHDQSIWSLLVKKYNLKLFKDPSQFGIIKFEYLKFTYSHLGVAHAVLKKQLGEYPIIIIQYRKEQLFKLLNRIKFKVKLKFKIILYRLLFTYLYEK